MLRNCPEAGRSLALLEEGQPWVDDAPFAIAVVAAIIIKIPFERPLEALFGNREGHASRWPDTVAWL